MRKPIRFFAQLIASMGLTGLRTARAGRLLLFAVIALLLFWPSFGVHAQGGHSITLSWTNPTSGTPATSVDVFRGTAAGAESATPVANVASPGTSYVDTNGVAGVTYFYVVKEKNQFGSSAASNEVSATFLGDPPQAAASLGAVAK